jgi:hypothetical protein
MASLAIHHSSLLVRQLASELDEKVQAKFQARTTHYLKLRSFIQASDPAALAEYDRLHPLPERASVQINRATAG